MPIQLRSQISLISLFLSYGSIAIAGPERVADLSPAFAALRNATAPVAIPYVLSEDLGDSFPTGQEPWYAYDVTKPLSPDEEVVVFDYKLSGKIRRIFLAPRDADEYEKRQKIDPTLTPLLRGFWGQQVGGKDSKTFMLWTDFDGLRGLAILHDFSTNISTDSKSTKSIGFKTFGIFDMSLAPDLSLAREALVPLDVLLSKPNTTLKLYGIRANTSDHFIFTDVIMKLAAQLSRHLQWYGVLPEALPQDVLVSINKESGIVSKFWFKSGDAFRSQAFMTDLNLINWGKELFSPLPQSNQAMLQKSIYQWFVSPFLEFYWQQNLLHFPHLYDTIRSVLSGSQIADLIAALISEAKIPAYPSSLAISEALKMRLKMNRLVDDKAQSLAPDFALKWVQVLADQDKVRLYFSPDTLLDLIAKAKIEFRFAPKEGRIFAVASFRGHEAIVLVSKKLRRAEKILLIQKKGPARDACEGSFGF